LLAFIADRNIQPPPSNLVFKCWWPIAVTLINRLLIQQKIRLKFLGVWGEKNKLQAHFYCPSCELMKIEAFFPSEPEQTSI
jgi:hypothetical protein